MSLWIALKNSSARWLVTAAIVGVILIPIHSAWTNLRKAALSAHSGFSWRVDPRRVAFKTNVTNINHFRPDLSRMLDDPQKISRDDLLAAQDYYTRIVQYFPDQSDAYGLIGFCEYHLGQKEKAVRSYQQAAAANPHFFWYPYNLGLMLWEGGQYTEAAGYFQQAMSVPPQETMAVLVSSRIYRELSGGKPVSQAMVETIKNAYRNGDRLRAHCLQKAGPTGSNPTEPLSPSEFPIRPF